MNRKLKIHFLLESNDGGDTIVFPAKLVPQADGWHRIQPPDPYPDFALSMDEEAFSSLAIVFLEKYIDRSLIPLYSDCDMCYYVGELYDYYGDNLYTYKDISWMLKEIKETAEAIRNEQRTPIIDELVSAINPIVFRGAPAGISREDLLIEYKEEIADYYDRFCAAVQSVMDKAPEYEYLDFCGP